MRALTIALPVVALAAVAGLTRSFGITPEVLAAFIAPMGVLAPVLFLALGAVRPLVLFPGIAFTIAAGFLWGPVAGTLLAAGAATLGGMTAFVLARRLGRERVADRAAAHPRLQRLLEGAGFRSVLVSRMLPFVPYDAVHCVAGVSGMRFAAFVAATFLGSLPGSFMYVAGVRAVFGA